MKPDYLKAIESIDADRKRWMKTELMVDLQITGEMAETLIDEYFGKSEPAPTFWIAKSRLDRILSKEINWPHVYTTDQSDHFECVPLFISAPTPAPAAHLRWLPIERADKSTDRIYNFPGMPRPIANSEEYWCRDADGRVFLATWADDGKRAYWWDLEGESPVDPVEFMPHPLDNRFSSEADSDR